MLDFEHLEGRDAFVPGAADGIGVSVRCPGPTSPELSARSAVSRARRLGGPVEVSEPETGEAGAAILAERVETPERVAEIALARLSRGRFVNRPIRRDVETRHREIERGFEAL